MQQGTADKLLGTISPLIKKGTVGWANLPKGAGSVLVERATGCRILSPEGNLITSSLRIKFRRKIRYDSNAFKIHAIKYEGFAPYMYLDTEGLVTVGIGHQIKDMQAAMSLPFHDRKTKAQTHSIHKKNAYLKVLNSGITNGSLRAFQNVTQIDLDPGEIGKIFNNDVNIFIGELTQNNRFPDFETYPGLVQRGILDLAFNLGMTIFFKLFIQFQAAVRGRNWIEVANQSRRTEIDEQGNLIENVQKRNNVVQGWFLLAINEEPFYVNPTCQPKPLSKFSR